jgi:ubiquinone/menaquinone biosynthesis C-methylase UbiE
MREDDRGQVTRSAAEVYDEFFVPALFQDWATRVADAARIETGQRVLDVACGTGVLAREIARRVGPSGAVVGVDVNEGMLAVARRNAPRIEWRQGRAEALPFDDDGFDHVVCQFALMFFEDRRAAIREMTRVLRPGGQLTVAVWGRVENFGGYAALAALAERLFGPRAGDALRAPFNLGDTRLLSSLFADAGVADVRITTHEGTARFPSIRAWLFTEVKGWVLADMLDDAQFELLLREAEPVLRPFVTAEGTVAFAAPAHIVTATKG